MRAALGLLLALALASSAWAQLGVPSAPPSAPPGKPTTPGQPPAKPAKPTQRPAGATPFAFTPVTVLPMATRAGGSYGPVTMTVPTGVVGVSAIIDVSQATDPLPAITMILEGSLDTGTTWMSAGSFTRDASPKGTDRQGQVITQIVGTFYGGPFWSDAPNVNRRLRGVASLGGTMRFSFVVQPL